MSFDSNRASNFGGALRAQGNLLCERCSFTNNKVRWGLECCLLKGAGQGGACSAPPWSAARSHGIALTDWVPLLPMFAAQAGLGGGVNLGRNSYGGFKDYTFIQNSVIRVGGE